MTPEDLARMADAELGPLPPNHRGPAPRIVASPRAGSSARVTAGGGLLAVPGFFRKRSAKTRRIEADRHSP